MDERQKAPGRPAGETPSAVEGYLDNATPELVNGWAWKPDRPLDAVTLRVLADGHLIARVVADRHRPDVELAGIGTGRYGFELRDMTKPPLGTLVIAVEDDATGAPLTHSPMSVGLPLQLPGPTAAAIEALFDSPASDEDLLARAEFAARQADRLLQRVAERRSDRQSRAAQRARKWRWQGQDRPEPPKAPARALVIDNSMPEVGRDAGSNALMSQMASLRRLGFEVLFAPADMRNGPGARMLEDAGIGCVTEPWYASVEEVMRREGSEFDLLYLHKHEAAARYVALARHTMRRARRVYAVADLHGLRLARQAQVEERPELVPHARFLHQTEIASAAACHAVVTHSAVEAEILRKALPHIQVEVVPWHVPVDPTPKAFGERGGLAFCGNFEHVPNVDAALWLRDEIMPLVWKVAPDIVCTLAGNGMPRLLLESRDPRVHAIGRVEALADLFGTVRLTVAPLAFGAGLKGKVVDSLALGVPCVCTPIAAEGFDLPQPLRDLVAEDAAGVADSIVRLHCDAQLFAACREAGLTYAAEAFSEAVVDAGLSRATGGMVQPT